MVLIEVIYVRSSYHSRSVNLQLYLFFDELVSSLGPQGKKTASFT